MLATVRSKRCGQLTGMHRSLPGPQLLDDLDQSIEVDGLRDDRFISIDPAAVDTMCRRHDRDWNGGKRRVSPPLIEEGIAVHHRHHQVEQDGRRKVRRGAQELQRLEAIRGREDLESAVRERLGENLPDIEIVVDDQYRCVAHQCPPYTEIY